MEISQEQESMLRASLLERQSQEIAEKIDYLSQQIADLSEFSKNIGLFAKSSQEGKEAFSSLGRGVYVKSILDDNNLFVNVGSGVVVKKTPEETKKIIDGQLSSFHEAKLRLTAQMEIYNQLLSQAVSEFQKNKKD